MIRILFLCWILTRHALSQTVSWTVGTSVPRYNEDLKLDCTVSTGCCTSFERIWTNATGSQIMNNGISTPPNKYVEVWNTSVTTGFSLMIKNLQLSDVGVVYDCQYKLGTSPKQLTQDGTWEYPPIEQCPVDSSSVFLNRLVFTYDIERSAPLPSVLVSFGGENVTSGLTITGPTNFDTWFYRLTVSMNVVCRNEGLLKLRVVTGTETTTVCNIKVKCFDIDCVIQALYYMVTGTLILGIPLGLIIACVFKIKTGHAYKDWKTIAVIAAVYVDVSFTLNNVIALLVAMEEYFCNLLLIVAGLGTGLVGVIVAYILYTRGEFDKGIFAPVLVLTVVEAIVIGVVDTVVIGNLFKGRCVECGFRTTGFAVVASIIGTLVFVLFVLKFFKKLIWKTSLFFGCLIILRCLLIEIVVAFPFGLYLCPCTDWRDPFFIIIGLVYSMILLAVYWRLFDKEEDNILTVLITFSGTVIGILIAVGTAGLKWYNRKGGKSQSVESGVGQDPNTSSSGPESVRRSPEKERADKKKERKPTEVVRPQPSRPLPSRAQHLKTDNTGREEYSAENELFKPRPLPSISGHSDSPRPLPKRTPDDQLEKGGIQLKPLVDSTSEKKKKKKRKKKETKQSDEDD